MRILRRALLLLLFTLITCSVFADGVLQIMSEDSTVEWDLRIDQQSLSFEQGMTVWLSEGIHRLQAYVEGYQQIDQPVRISQGERAEVLLSLNEVSSLYSPQVRKLSATPRPGILLVTGKTSGLVFSIDAVADIAPKVISLTKGVHELRSGSFSWEVKVKEGEATIVQLDTDTGKLKDFIISQTSFDVLIAEGGTLDDLFVKGYRLYGRDQFWNLRNILLVLALFLIFIGFCLWRFSLAGRVQVAIWRKHSGSRKVRSLTKSDPKGKMAGSARSLKKRLETIDNLDEILIKRIDTDKERFRSLKSEESPKSSKRLKSTKTRLRKMIRLRRRIASLKG